MPNPFINNKYTTWYFLVVNRALERSRPVEYCERHHIIPRCLGGANTRDNLVWLTAREHFVVHWLLLKMVSSSEFNKLVFAFNMMLKDKHGKRYSPSSRAYAIAREKLSEAMTGREVSKSTRQKIGDAHRGFKHTAAAKQKMANAKIGRPVIISSEHAAKISAALTGKPKSNSHRRALSEAKRGKPGITRTAEWKARIAEAQRLRWRKQREEPAN